MTRKHTIRKPSGCEKSEIQADSCGRGVTAPSCLISFWVPGQPVGKGRPRVYRGRAITPKRTVDYEKHVAQHAMVACAKVQNENRKLLDFSCQVFMNLYIYHSPKMRPQHKPDSDNVAKCIMDALSGILWEDDKHVLPRVQCETRGIVEAGVMVYIQPTGQDKVE